MAAISTPDEVYEREMRQHLDSRSHYEKAKSMTTIETQEVDVEKIGSTAGSIHWQPGVKARFPKLGFGAILTMLACIAFSVVILVTSDKKVREQWPVELRYKWQKNVWVHRLQLTPSVALAVTNTVSNVALAFAIGQGVAIAWWREALKGATVKDLHKSWSFSASILDLLTAGRSFNIVALTALTAKIALVDNLLLQKAADTIPGLYEQNPVNVRVPTWQSQLPSDFIGYFSDDNQLGAFTSNFSNVLHDYASSGSLVSESLIPDFIKTCDGTCFATVPGFGFTINCTANPHGPSVTITKEIAIKNTFNATSDNNSSSSLTLPSLLSFSAQQDLAKSAFDVTDPQKSGIYLHVSWADLVSQSGNSSDVSADSCILTNYSQICELRPALLNYSVEVDSFDLSTSVSSTDANGVQLTQEFDWGADDDQPFLGGQLKSWNINVTKIFDYDPTYDMNVKGFASMLETMFGGDIELQYLNGSGYVPASMGLSGSAIGTWWTPYMSWRPSPESCVMSITDPTEYIMEQLNHITFRASVYAGYNSWINYRYPDNNYTLDYSKESIDFMGNPDAVLPYIANTVADQFTPSLEYKSNYWFMGAAIFSMVFCVACVLPSYWGYWELGRKVTLGPMEIASAFQAPILEHPAVATRGGEVDILLKEVGKRKVRYGQVEGSGRLAVAEPDEVRNLTVPSAHRHWPKRR